MNVTSDLKLTFPIRWNDAGEPTLYAYHIPISRLVFEQNYRLIGGTLAMLQSKSVGANVVDVATLALKDIGRRDAREWGLPEGLSIEDGGMAVPLLAELKRLTWIIAPTATGYESIPATLAIARNVVSAEDWEEAEAGLVFFTCGYATKRRNLPRIAEILSSDLLGSTTSLLPTEWAASLAGTSTAVESSLPAPVEPASTEVPQ
jgi:hypothetical protein